MLIKSPSAGVASAIVFIAAALWGGYWIPLRHLEQQGVTGTSAIILLSLPAVLPLMLWVVLQWSQHKHHISTMLLIGFFTGSAIALYASGVLFSSVVRATLLFYLTPVWATLIEIYWFKQKIEWTRWLAAAMGLSGMLLLLSGEGSSMLNPGDILAFLSGVAWAIGAAMIKHFDKTPLPGITLSQFTFTSMIALLIGYLIEPENSLNLPQLITTIPLASAVSVLILLPAILAICWAQKFIYPGRVGLLMMSEVLVAVISASILLPDERMSVIEWCGAIMIISCCLIEVTSLLKPKKKSPAAELVSS